MRTLLLLLSALGTAQDQADPKTKISCTFRTLSLEAAIENGVFIEGQSLRAHLIPADFFSVTEKYHGDASVRFGRLPPTASQEDPRAVPLEEEKRALSQAEQADAAYVALTEDAATVIAAAPEGAAGESARQRGQKLMLAATEKADAARQARTAARQARSAADGLSLPARPKSPAKKSKLNELTQIAPLGQVALADGKNYLLLFTGTNGANRILPFIEPTEAHPFGQLRFINLAPYPLEIRSRNPTRIVSPQQSTVFKPATDEHGYAGLEIRRKQSDGKPLRTLRVFPENDARTTYFVMTDPLSGKLIVKAVHERRGNLNTPTTSPADGR